MACHVAKLYGACHVLAIYRSLRGDQKRMSTEADTCRKYVVPICLGGGGSLFCGLKTFLPRRLVAAECNEDGSQTKAGAFAVLAFSLQPLALACVLGKFSGTDQLRNGVP
jgi:hypothetical protein